LRQADFLGKKEEKQREEEEGLKANFN